MKYTVIFKLSGSLAKAVSVEWTDVASPVNSGAGWEPCLRLPNGDWRMSSYDAAAGRAKHWHEPGAFDNIGLRYRLKPAALWSPISKTRKAITIVAVEVGAPALVAAPALAGTGKIGSEVTVQPGLWSGDPVPDLALQWQCGGADIAGATGTSYVPVPGDDGKDLACAVSASNAAGSERAITASLRVTYVAPVAKGKLPEEIFDQGFGIQTVDAAADFTGANLRYGVTGAGATIDAATGLVSIPTDAPVSGEMVTITATNSGGSATSAFQVTVEATEARPRAPLNADWVLDAIRYPTKTSTSFTGTIEVLPSLAPPKDIADMRWFGIDVANYADEAALEPHWRPMAYLGVGPNGGSLWRFSDVSGTDYIRPHGNVMQRIRFEYMLVDGTLWSYYPTDAKVLSEGLIEEPLNATGYYFMDIRTPEELQAGLKGGSQAQFFHGLDRSLSDPSLLVGGQDSGGTWRSDDDGKTWVKNQDKGLMGYGIQGIKIDPEDPNRWYTLGETLFQLSSDLQYGGIYMTVDKGHSWTLQQSMPGDLAHQRVPVEVAVDPNTTGSGITIYFTAHYRDGHGEVWRSTNRGVSWSLRKTVPLSATSPAVSGHVSGIQHHPSVSGTVFLCTHRGLWKSTDAGANWAKMSGSGGLPDMEVVRVAINPANGNEMYAIANAPTTGVGTLWRTTNGGTNWTQINIITSGVAYRGSKVYVGNQNGGGWAAVGSRTLYVTGRGGGEGGTMMISQNGGTSWAYANVSGRPGDNDGWGNEMTDSTDGSSRPALLTRIMPDPIVANRAFGHSHACNFRTDNAVTWRYSGEGFSGLCHTKFRSGVSFTTDPNRFAVGFTDSGFGITRDGGRSFWWSRINGKAPDGHSLLNSVQAIAMHPTSNIIVASSGNGDNTNDTYLFRTTAANPTSADWTRLAPAPTYWYYLHWNKTTPTVVYGWGQRSLDSGLTWAPYPGMGGMGVCSVYPGNEDTIYGLELVSGQTQFRRSTDRGATSSIIVTAPWDAKTIWNPREFIIAVHPSNPDYFFTRSASGDLARWNGSSWKTDYNIFGLHIAANPTAPSGHQRKIRDVIIDPQDANTGYVIVYCVGFHSVWRTTNLLSNNPTWEDVTFNLWRGDTGFNCDIHPLTGDAMFGSLDVGGFRILPPPAVRSSPTLTRYFNIYQ